MHLNWEFMLQSLPLYQKAAILTLQLAIGGIGVSLLIGLLCSIILYYKTPILSSVVRVYIEFSRNTPLLIQLFFLYYGFTKLGLTMGEYTCAILGLSFLGGSYMAEAFRGGMESVGKSQIEAGLSLGLSNRELIRYVILPQAFTVSLPAVGANCIFLLKETSIVGAIAIPELMHLTQDLIGMYYQTYESLFMLVVSYLIMLLPLSFGLTWLERKLRYAEFGN
ncbi:amino acid ABC transporter permease [Anaerospora sp.]|uniref:amino acid ABC transporter permease n=1 Tax=Anaerospora sp. TaxID=1960278 RepID=UPI0028A0810D|nr:amino acid ABC transporter permease [Anaerospora sp.]